MVFHQGVFKPGSIAGRQVRVGRSSPKPKSGLALDQVQRLLNTGSPNICIIRSLGGVGDVLMTTPALKALKHKWPKCHLTYATDFNYINGCLKDILKYNPYIDEVIEYQIAKTRDYDFVSDVTSCCVNLERPGVKVDNRIDLFAAHIGVSLDEVGHVPVYIVSEEEKEWAKKKLERYPRHSRNGPRIGIQVRSSTPSRTWPIERTRELAIRLVNELGAQVCMFDSSHGSGSQSEEWNIPGLVPFKDYDMRSTCALINEVDLLIAPDSGLMHIAGALNKKIVSIWAGTDYRARINHYPNAVAVVRDNYSCYPCVAGDSWVLTIDGYKEIQDINVDDVVKTATSELKPVTELHKTPLKERSVLKIQPMGYTESFKVTNDHKLLVLQKNNNNKPLWVKSEDINTGDYLCVPRNKYVQSDFDDSEDMCWLYGLYMAEGDVRYAPDKRVYRVRLTLNANEDNLIDKCYKITDKLGIKMFVQDKRPKEETKIVTISRKFFTEKILSLFGKNKSVTKQIPIQIFTASDKQIIAFLNGYFSGDGYLDKRERIYSTASKQIAYGLQELYSRFGQFARVYKRVRDTNYKKNSIIYRIYVHPEFGYHSTRYSWWRDKDYIYTPIKTITDTGKSCKYVYDITVEDDPTFTVNNLAVYDCWYSAKVCNKAYTCLHSISVDEVARATYDLLGKPVYEPSIMLATKPVSVEFDYCIVRDNGIGDIVTCLPAFSAFKKKNPDKKILFATMTQNVEFAKLTGCFDNVLPLASKWDTVDHHNILDARDLFEQQQMPNGQYGCYFENCSRLEKMSEFLDVKPDIDYKLPKDNEYTSKFYNLLASKGVDPEREHLISLQFGATCNARSWPREHIKSLLIKLSEIGYTCLMLGSPYESIYDSYKCVNLSGETNVRMFNATIASSDAFIGVDSGGVHLAAHNNVPFVAIFNAIEPKYRLSYYDNYRVIFPRSMDCAPCFDKGCDDMQCMRMMDSQIVFDAFRDLTSSFFQKTHSEVSL